MKLIPAVLLVSCLVLAQAGRHGGGGGPAVPSAVTDFFAAQNEKNCTKWVTPPITSTALSSVLGWRIQLLDHASLHTPNLTLTHSISRVPVFDGIDGIQDLKIYSHAHSLILCIAGELVRG